MNEAKSDLQPRQQAQYLGMTLDSESVQAFPSQARLVSLGNVVRSFLEDPAPRAREWQSVLGHLASLEKLVPHGRLRMRSLQFQLKGSWSASGDPNARIPWTKQIAEDLAWWTNPSNLAQGVPLSSPPLEVPYTRMPPRRGGELTSKT